MKAEERHKLQTNALADRLGRFIQRVKQGPSRGTVTTVLLALVLAGLVFFFFWTRGRSRSASAESWVALYNGTREHLEHLADKEAQTAPGRAARFQYAFLYVWQGGIKQLMTKGHAIALENIKKGRDLYSNLADEVKDDPVWGPEALYGVAAAEEALAIEDTSKQLEIALRAYNKVAETHPNSALGKAAAQRATELKKGPSGRRDAIEDLYSQLSLLTLLERRDRLQLPPGLKE